MKIKLRIGLIPLALVSAGLMLGQSAGGKIVPAFSIEPNVIGAGAESTVSIAIANANPNSTQMFRAGDVYIITLNQPGISIVRIDPVVVVRSMTLAPADFVAGYAVQHGQPSANQLAIQYVGPDKVFQGGDSFGAILTVTAPLGAASSSVVFQLPANDPDRFVTAVPPTLNLLASTWEGACARPLPRKRRWIVSIMGPRDLLDLLGNEGRPGKRMGNKLLGSHRR